MNQSDITVHKNITIHGEVQGVGFRYAARSQARYTGIKGFVKNQYDGTVYIEAEGDTENINEFLSWCAKGPSYAHVEHIDVSQGPVKNFRQFEIAF